jgi:energy-coupling factor transporter ATP-binding protein EcfA2
MFQFPSTQSIMIALTGKEGTGKSALVDLITNILGKDKSKEIIDIDQELFGAFNGDMSMKVFYNINEISKKDVMMFDNKLKTRITSPMVRINEKGVKPYFEQNLGHYMLTTNMDNVLNIKESSRRYFAYETNDEKIGDVEYFNTVFACVHNKKFQYSFYRFMMERNVKKQFTIKDIPITETMKESFVLNRDVIEDYAEQVHWVGECDADENYIDFKTYLQSNGYNKYEITKKSFEMKFNKHIDKYGIIKRKVDTKEYRGIKYSKTLMINVE